MQIFAEKVAVKFDLRVHRVEVVLHGVKFFLLHFRVGILQVRADSVPVIGVSNAAKEQFHHFALGDPIELSNFRLDIFESQLIDANLAQTLDELLKFRVGFLPLKHIGGSKLDVLVLVPTLSFHLFIALPLES